VCATIITQIYSYNAAAAEVTESFDDVDALPGAVVVKGKISTDSSQEDLVYIKNFINDLLGTYLFYLIHGSLLIISFQGLLRWGGRRHSFHGEIWLKSSHSWAWSYSIGTHWFPFLAIQHVTVAKAYRT
jgi:hypothetical protein